MSDYNPDSYDNEADAYAAWCAANPLTPEQQAFLDVRRAEAPNIDPETAEVEWDYGVTLDPYGIFGVPRDFWCVGREYFARRPVPRSG